MLNLKLQYFGHLMWRTNSLEKTMMLGKIEGRRRRGRPRMRRLEGITDSVDMRFSKLWEIAKDREAWSAAVCGVTKNWTRLSNWTTMRSNATESPRCQFNMQRCTVVHILFCKAVWVLVCKFFEGTDRVWFTLMFPVSWDIPGRWETGNQGFWMSERTNSLEDPEM